jgi:phage terminase small subunit
MAPLKNIRHERFCLELAKGKSQSEAYQIAGYTPNEGNAFRLTQKEVVKRRLEELLERMQERAVVSVDRLAKEYARIGYGDITDVLSFNGKRVKLKDSAQLGPDITAAISEVRQTKDGIVIKMHNKVAALDALARHKGMFKENIDLKITVSLADLVNQSYEEPKLVEGKVVEDD